MNIDHYVAAIVAACIYLLGVGTGYWLFHDRAAVHETPAAAVALPATAAAPHGGEMIAREPERAAKPAQRVPAHVRVLRVQQVTIRPADAQAEADKAAAPHCPPPKPVTLDLTQVQSADGGQRLLASSPDGTVIGGFDVPLSPASIALVHPWAAGASYGTDRTYGAWIERDMGRLRLGADILQMPDGGLGARARIGVAFGS